MVCQQINEMFNRLLSAHTVFLYNTCRNLLISYPAVQARYGVKRFEVTDRDGRKIYLTEERWEHILSRHLELAGRREDVLETIRRGRRRQAERDPQTFLYYYRVESLSEPYNLIAVIVAFRYRSLPDSNEQIPNNFVVTAWGNVSAP